MEEQQVINIIRNYLETQFPKTCSNCKQVYPSLENYLRKTSHLGMPVSYDAEFKDWKPKQQIGTVSLANCSCGNTLAFNSKGIGLLTMWRLLSWARKESRKRQIPVRQLLHELRKKIDRSVLDPGTELAD